MASKIIKSALGGSVSSLFYFISAYELDKKYSPKKANLIAYSFTILLNFIFQYNVFLKSSLTMSNIYKYAILVLIEIIANQTMVSYLIDKKQDLIKYIPQNLRSHYNTIVRVIVESTIFLVLSYPARLRWVFK